MIATTMKRMFNFDISPQFSASRAGLYLLFVIAMTGCATTGYQTNTDEVLATIDADKLDNPEDTARAETLYKLLVAEFAGHRGELGRSVKNYLQVAKDSQDADVAQRAMRIAVYASDAQAAEKAAHIWVAQEPESLEAHRALAALYIRGGKIHEGVNELYRLASITAKDGKPEYGMIYGMLNSEKAPQIAFEVIKDFMQGDARNDPMGILTYANLALKSGKTELAYTLLEDLIKAEPDNKAAQMGFAQILRVMGRTDDSLKYLSQLIKSDPSDQKVRLVYAQQLVTSKRYKDAIREFKKLEKALPENNEIIFALSLVLVQTEHFTDARKRLQKLIDRGVHTDVSHYYLGQIAEFTKNDKNALKEYVKVVRGKYYFDARVRASVVMSKMGKLEEARNFLHATRTQGSKQEVKIFLVDGELLENAKQYQHAFEVYSAGIRTFPENTELLYARGMTAEKLDRIDVLEADFKSILSRHPNHTQALNALGYTLADKTGRYQEAYGYIERALKQRPGDFYILDSMGWVLFRMGRYDESIKYLQKASDASGDAEVAAHLGQALWNAGKQKQARQVLNDALLKEPDDQRLLDAVKRLKIK